MGQGKGRGRGQGSQAKTSGTQGAVYAITPQAELADQLVIRVMFLLFCLWGRMLFDFGASYSFVVVYYVKYLGLEVETLENSLYVNSPLGTGVSIDLIYRDCELEILRILLTIDLRVMHMSEFDVILGMDWLTAHLVVIDFDRRRVTTYTPDDVYVMFQGDKHNVMPQALYYSRWHGRFQGWLVNLTLEDEVRQELGVPRVVCEYTDVFLKELLGLPMHRDVDFCIELYPDTLPISMTPHRMEPTEF